MRLPATAIACRRPGASWRNSRQPGALSRASDRVVTFGREYRPMCQRLQIVTRYGLQILDGITAARLLGGRAADPAGLVRSM